MNFYKKEEDTGKQTSFDQPIIDYMNFETWLKKKQKSPKVNDQKMLKTFYSKRKAKSENSPKNESRVNPRDLIKINIKDLQCQPSQRPIRRHPEQASGQRSTLRSSLTPKSFHYSKPGAKSSKGGQTRGKQLFKSSGRQGNYPQTQQDLRHALERKKQQDLKEKERGIYRRNYASYDSNCVAQGKAHEEQTTVKISERVRDQGGFNVRACLTPDEYSKFGERFPENFKRAGLLGRGGFSVVWLAIHRFSKRKVAVKQILTKNPHQTHLKEIWFGSYFFQKGGQSRQQFEDHIGINNICRLLSYEIGPVDTWLYYQLCEESLGSCLFQLKGESVGGQRIYRIDYKQVIESIRVDQNQLQTLIVQVSKGLLLMNSHNIVHSDLKTENILLRLRRPQQIRQGHGLIRGVKLIDFGSSFLFTNLKQFSMATPQYMPPQILNYILYQNKLEYNHEMLTQMDRYKNSWIIDIWSLGCIILEIISGVPLWMSIDTKIQGRGSKVTGLFAIKNRVFAKIIQKQIEVISNLDYHLDNNNHSGIEIRQDIRIVLKKMLHLDPEQRISPIEILKHFKVSCQPLRIPSY